MTKHTDVVLHTIPATIGTADPGQWIAEGRSKAEIDPSGVFETLADTNAAEAATYTALAKQIEARGGAALAQWNSVKDRLKEMGFDVADHLHRLAQGKLDLYLAVILLAVGAALTAFVLFAYAPLWMTVLLGFLVLASAAAVEEFFEAHQQKATLRQGIFLTLAFIALVAQLCLGMLRGILLGALAPATSGPATQALGMGAMVLRYTLGAFSLVAEVVAGYKLWRARSALLALRKPARQKPEGACIRSSLDPVRRARS